MLRCRNQRGKVVDIPAGCTIELVDRNGHLAVVWLFRDPETVACLCEGDREFADYARMTKQKTSRTIHLEDPTQEPHKLLV